MLISGDYIRENAAKHEETCPKAMKDSFYYGFREGAKWMQKELLNLFKEKSDLNN